MIKKHGTKWSREETILAMDLYCQVPFGSIHKNNPLIIQLAELIGRTPGSVGLKMANLAHFDPELQKRSVSAMAHGSKLDEEIFNEFYMDLSELSYQAQTIKSQMGVNEAIPLDSNYEILIDTLPPGEYREALIKQRLGQSLFRRAVLMSYGNSCCITGLKQGALLIASHIKPWSVSDDKTERTNPSNGLCLNALHDRAFDKGLITINQKYEVVISTRIKEVGMDSNTYDWFMSYEKKRIVLPEKFFPRKDFIEYHNDVVFQR